MFLISIWKNNTAFVVIDTICPLLARSIETNFIFTTHAQIKKNIQFVYVLKRWPNFVYIQHCIESSKDFNSFWQISDIFLFWSCVTLQYCYTVIQLEQFFLIFCWISKVSFNLDSNRKSSLIFMNIYIIIENFQIDGKFSIESLGSI